MSSRGVPRRSIVCSDPRHRGARSSARVLHRHELRCGEVELCICDSSFFESQVAGPHVPGIEEASHQVPRSFGCLQALLPKLDGLLSALTVTNARRTSNATVTRFRVPPPSGRRARLGRPWFATE